MDFLRAFSIAVVVLGHWLIAAVYWRDGRITGENALHVTPGLWLATWILQVMPLFFFVRGFSNLVTIDSVRRKGGDYLDFIYGRTVRLMRPTAVLLIVWLPIVVATDLFSTLSDRVLSNVTSLMTRPLWFIGIYLIVILFAPLMAKVHRRFGFAALTGLVSAAALIDIAAIGFGVGGIGYLNFVFVWLFVHQLGYFYADGRLTIVSKRIFWLMAASGLAAMVVLTVAAGYSASMVGLRNERSNTNPPTVAIIALSLWQVGLAMLLRPVISRWLAKAKTWVAVIGVNSVIMTLFLWHQTAILIVVGALYPLGFPQPKAGTAMWWLIRPLWITCLLLVLAVLVAIFGKFERGAGRTLGERFASGERPQRAPGGGPANVAGLIGVVYVLMGILGFAVGGLEGFASAEADLLVGFSVNPLQNLLHILLGGFLLQGAAQGDEKARRSSLIAAGVLATSAVLGTGLSFPGVPNFLALNGPDHVLHAASSVALVVAALAAGSRMNRTAKRAV